MAALLAMGVLPAGASEADEQKLFSGSELSRGELVRAVLARNPSIESARHAWQAALAEIEIAESLPDPMVNVALAPASPFSSAGFGGSVSLSQRLPWPGKLELRADMEAAEAEAAQLGLEQTRLALALTASRLFDQYWLLHRALDINAEHRALLATFKAVATGRFTAGEASLQDPLQAEVEIAHILHRDVQLKTKREVLAAQLNRLLHRAPRTPLAPPPKEFELVDQLALPVLADAGVRALQARPEVLAAAARVQAAVVGTALAEKSYRPDFEVMASYNSMWMDPAHQWMVGVGVNVPIWRDRLRAQERAADERLAAARSAVVQTQDQILSEVATALSRLEEVAHELRLYRERLLPVARDQVAAARSGFESGRNTFLALIEAERNQRSVRLAYQEIIAQRATRRAQLARALGELPPDVADRAPRGEP